MELFRSNRYQLLFIDDEASDVCIGQTKLQKTRSAAGEGDQNTTTKRNKLPGARKAVQSKPLTGKTAHKTVLNRKADQLVIANANNMGDAGQQMQRRLHQQLEHPVDLLPELHSQYKERAVSRRIISNNNKDSGYGHARMTKSKHDRYSGSEKTSIKAVIKRNGDDAQNWSSAIGDIDEQSIAIKDDSFNDQQQPQQQQPSQSGQNAIDEDDAKYITVEEWRAQHEKRAKPVYNIRKAGEGEVTKPDWKKMIVLPKKNPQKLDSDYLEYDTSLYPQRVGRLHRVTDIEFKFKDDRRRSGYLSGWTSGRSMNKSEGESVSDPINMKDEIEFPTLG